MKSILVASLVAGGLLAGIAQASAETQPTGGYASTDRADQGTGGGPHCHFNVVAEEHSQSENFDRIAVFPSHTGHVQTTGIFAADPECDGQ